MRPALLSTALLWLGLLTAVAVGQGHRTTIDVSEIHAGMHGYGLTVFRGFRPERFGVEVLGVLHNFQPSQDLILIRTSHPILDHATTVAGMSGSPVYIDGRLAGAYAYGWPFGKDPVAGVTPIANMLAEERRPVRPDAFPGAEPLGARSSARGERQAAADTGRRFAGLPPYTGHRRVRPLDTLRTWASRTGLADATVAGPQGLVRTATPLMLGGFTDAAARVLGRQLEPLGLMVLQAGGGSGEAAATDTTGLADHFVDGGSIGVQLVRGDIDATAVGTVTHIDGRRLVAFGHPMMDAGEVGLPTSTARVIHILASESRSFKIAEAVSPIGTLIQDRQSAIVVEPGLRPATVPVTVRLHGVSAPKTEWHMEVASHRTLTPLLSLAAILNALTSADNGQTDVLYTAHERIGIAGHGDVVFDDLGYMASGPADPQALSNLRLFDALDAAYGNPFEKTRVTSITVDLSVRFSRDIVTIVDAAVPVDEVDPGGTVNLHVTLRRFGHPAEVRIVPLHVPARAAGQKIKLEIQAGDDVDLELPDPRSLSDMLQMVRAGYPATKLVVSLQMPSRGLRFRGHVVHALPPSALDALELVNDSAGGTPFVTETRQTLDIGRVLTGSAEVELHVRQTPRGR